MLLHIVSTTGSCFEVSVAGVEGMGDSKDGIGVSRVKHVYKN